MIQPQVWQLQAIVRKHNRTHSKGQRICMRRDHNGVDLWMRDWKFFMYGEIFAEFIHENKLEVGALHDNKRGSYLWIY